MHCREIVLKQCLSSPPQRTRSQPTQNPPRGRHDRQRHPREHVPRCDPPRHERHLHRKPRGAPDGVRQCLCSVLRQVHPSRHQFALGSLTLTHRDSFLNTRNSRVTPRLLDACSDEVIQGSARWH